MVAPVLTVALALAGAPPDRPVDTSLVTQPQSVLHTPDAILPAVLPYIACLYGLRGLPFVAATNAKRISYDKSDGTCLAERQRATAGAVRLLKGKTIPGGVSATAYIESVLSDVDASVATLPIAQSRETARHSPIAGTPFVMEDEVLPAYNHYEDCLKTQVSFAEVSVNTIETVFMQAMSICRSVRDQSVAEARLALTKKGWTAEASAQAAENTFATADRSWLETARQFRDRVVSRTSKPREK